MQEVANQQQQQQQTMLLRAFVSAQVLSLLD
jgi:hypothetical protein